MQTGDPFHTYLGNFVNEAANAIVLLAVSKDKRNINSFPELRRRRWSDITVNNQGYLTKPSNALVIDSVSVTKSSDAYDPSRSTEYPVIEENDQTRFALYDKSTTTVGYPTVWSEAAGQILLWPTPTTAYLTRVVVRGIRKEDALVNDADTFVMNEVFHPVIIDYATYLTMQRMGLDEAEKFLTSAEKRLTQNANILGLEKRRNRNVVEVAGSL